MSGHLAVRSASAADMDLVTSIVTWRSRATRCGLMRWRAPVADRRIMGSSGGCSSRGRSGTRVPG